MSEEECSHECGSCGEEGCEDRIMTEQGNASSNVGKVIGVVSGKGGVGKSLVTSLLAVSLNKAGYKVGILDADVTGPSIPKIFGIPKGVKGTVAGILPSTSSAGIAVMSVNLMLDKETDPVIWRGPIIGNTVKQFWTDVVWGDLDYLLIDMPPGTGDVALTVFQSLPVDGIVMVTSPQDLVSMIVSKAQNMAEKMDIPVLGLVENMSYFRCPDNGKDYQIFGESHIEDIAQEHGLDLLARIPINPELAKACDAGRIEDVEDIPLDGAVAAIVNIAGAAEAPAAPAEPAEHESAEENTMLKIAVASSGTDVTQHFGHCPYFLMFTTENGKIVSQESIDNPGHKPGFLPNFLADQGANVIISGGMGQGAVDIFNERGMEVITGASGDATSAVEAYLRGELESTGSVCHEHAFEGECDEH